MSKYNTPVITDVGLKALRQHAQSNGTFYIDKVVATNRAEYVRKDSEYLRKLTELNGNLYEGSIESVYDNENAYSFNVKFDNLKLLKDDLIVTAIGLYGHNESGEEKLFLVTNTRTIDETETIPARKDNDLTYTFTAHILLDINSTENVTVKFNYNGYVKWADLNKHIEEADKKYIQSVNSVKRDNNSNVDVTDTITQDFPANITDVHELPAGNFKFTNLSNTQFNNLRNKPQGIDKYAFIKTFRRDGLGNSGDGWQVCFTTTDLEKVWYSGRNSGGWSDWKNIVNRSTYTDQEIDTKLKEAGKVKTVNGISPDNSGNVDTHINEVILGESGMGFASLGKAEYVGKNLYLNPDKVLEGLTADNIGDRLVRKSEIQSFGNVKKVEGVAPDNLGNITLPNKEIVTGYNIPHKVASTSIKGYKDYTPVDQETLVPFADLLNQLSGNTDPYSGNLNEKTQTGTYFVTPPTNWTTCSYPWGNWSILRVDGNNSSRIKQEIWNDQSPIRYAYRFKRDNSWTDWIEVANKSDVAGSIKSISLNGGVANTPDNNDKVNLDVYTKSQTNYAIDEAKPKNLKLNVQNPTSAIATHVPINYDDKNIKISAQDLIKILTNSLLFDDPLVTMSEAHRAIEIQNDDDAKKYGLLNGQPIYNLTPGKYTFYSGININGGLPDGLQSKDKFMLVIERMSTDIKETVVSADRPNKTYTRYIKYMGEIGWQIDDWYVYNAERLG